MPCRSEGSPLDSGFISREQFEKEFTHNSQLAEIFCKTMQEIDELSSRLVSTGRINFQIAERMPHEAQKWWKEHQERDRVKTEAERKEQERLQAIQTALNKLTPKEQNLLGVKIKG